MIFDLRPCVVSNLNKSGERYTKNALFHRWVEYNNKLDPLQKDKIRVLVEYQNGEVDLLPHENIRFLDSKHDEYSFEEK